MSFGNLFSIIYQGLAYAILEKSHHIILFIAFVSKGHEFSMNKLRSTFFLKTKIINKIIKV